MAWLIWVLVGLVVLVLLAGLAYYAIQSGEEREARVSLEQRYGELDAEYQQFQKVAHGAVSEAIRHVDELSFHVLQERERGHDARLEILRLAADANRRQS